MFKASSAISGAVIALSLIVSSCSTEEPVARAQPLTFQVIRASNTTAPQFMLEINFEAVPPGRGVVPVPEATMSSKPITRSSAESFIILDFTLSGFTQQVPRINVSDFPIQLIDKNGTVYTALGEYEPILQYPSTDKPWVPLGSLLIGPGETKRFLFKVPDNTINGMSVSFQGKQYPLSATT
jgi:hypothetical protein